MMNAAIYRSFGGPIQIEKVPLPQLTDDCSVLLQVKATGVCRSDWHGWKGHDGDIVQHGLPFCPGHELSGVVVKKGSMVKTIELGDAVAVPFILSCGHCEACHARQKPTVCFHQQQPGFTCWGSFAEYVCLPRADRNLRRLPKDVSFVQAAALGCRFTTAYRAVLQQGNLQPKRSVAVFGCGGLGLSCVMMAVLVGASPIVAVDVSKAALEKAQQLGATHALWIQDKKESAESVQQRLYKTVPNGVDLSLDAAGFAATSEYAVWCTRRAGRMVQVGLPLGGRPPAIPMGRVAGWEIEIVGSHGFAATDLPDLLAMVANRKLRPDLLVEECVSLKKGIKTLQNMDKTSPLGMTVITSFGDDDDDDDDGVGSRRSRL